MATIKLKIGNCCDCGPASSNKPLIAGRCQYHYWRHRQTIKPTVIRKVSKKLAKDNRIYNQMRLIFLQIKPICEARLEGCFGKSTDVHHKAGRGVYHLDYDTWLAVCRNCHSIIEVNPEMAKESNFSISRLEYK